MTKITFLKSEKCYITFEKIYMIHAFRGEVLFQYKLLTGKLYPACQPGCNESFHFCYVLNYSDRFTKFIVGNG